VILRAVGFGQKIWRAGAGVALLISAAAAAAEPAEPLTVTQLGDPETTLQISTFGNVGGSDRDLGDFGRAVSEALRVQQQSIEGRCNSAHRNFGTTAARWAWEARCRYQRY
jgi:hypothetical protein